MKKLLLPLLGGLAILSVALYFIWGDTDVSWPAVRVAMVLSALAFVFAWIPTSLLLVLYQWWRNDKEYKPNPFGTRLQRKEFWRTFRWGPFMVILLAFAPPGKPFKWTDIDPRKPMPS